jgi:hypothetical protein
VEATCRPGGSTRSSCSSQWARLRDKSEITPASPVIVTFRTVEPHRPGSELPTNGRCENWNLGCRSENDHPYIGTHGSAESDCQADRGGSWDELICSAAAGAGFMLAGGRCWDGRERFDPQRAFGVSYVSVSHGRPERGRPGAGSSLRRDHRHRHRIREAGSRRSFRGWRHVRRYSDAPAGRRPCSVRRVLQKSS